MFPAEDQAEKGGSTGINPKMFSRVTKKKKDWFISHGFIFSDVEKHFTCHRHRQDPGHGYLNLSSVSSLLLPTLGK